MDWLDVNTMMLDGGRTLTGIALNWLVQSTLLVGVGMLTAYLLRGRGSAVQSAIYRTTVVAVLVCPLATFLLSLLGVSGWSLDMPIAYTIDHVVEASVVEPPPAARELQVDFANVPQEDPRALEISAPPILLPDIQSEFRPDAVVPVQAGNDTPAPPVAIDIEAPADDAPVPIATRALQVEGFGVVAAAAGALWFGAAIWLLARLLSAYGQLHKLRRGAWPAESATIEKCRELAARFEVPPPQVLCSPYLPSPCLAGLRRPAVLLPEAELTLPVHDVLVHELAHLKRHDCFWNMLRQVMTAVLPFQPLAWMLSRRLGAAAEEVCDDYVVEFGGDRRQYAEQLVNIAELSIAPAAAAGVGIVSFRSMLAQRVARIMDTTRSLSTRVGSLLLAIVLLAGLAATMIVGLVGVEPHDAVASAAEESGGNDDEVASGNDATTDGTAKSSGATATDEPVESSTDKPVESNTAKVVSVQGRVLDSNGVPVADARVVATQSRWVDRQFLHSEHRQVNETRSRADGTFEFAVPEVEPVDFHKNRLLSYAWKPPAIMATAPGYVSAWVGGGEMPVEDENPLDGEVLLRLHKESPKIHGRLVNLEGQPLSGLSVQVKMLAVAEPEKVEQWLATVDQLRKEGKLSRTDDALSYTFFTSAMVMDSQDAKSLKDRRSAYFPMKTRLLPGHPHFPASVQTDTEGRFEMTGLPPDCLAVLEISGPDVMTHAVSIVTRDIERIDVPNTGFPGADSHGYYGVEFDHPVAPGAAIVGTVKDAKSGRPLVGAQVTASAIMANRMALSQSKWASATDVDGRFQIDGLPTDGEKRIQVIPPQDQPYLTVDWMEVPQSSGVEPVDMEIKLRRGVFVRGKVIDAETGEPIDATLHYHPLLSNDHAREYGYDPQRSQFDEGERCRTSEDGGFQAVVIPGRGILGVQAVERGAYCVGLGSKKIATKESGHFAVYDIAIPNLFNRVVEIDVPGDVEEIKQDLTVSHGVNVTLRVQDPQGKPLFGVQASGLTPMNLPGSDRAEDASLEFKSLRPGEARRVLLMHKERRLGRIENVTAPESDDEIVPRTVTLEPCATVTGRVVDGEGEPVAGMQFTAYALPVRDLDVVSPQQVATDADGRFRFEYLPAGATYRIVGHNQQLGVNQQFGFVELVKKLEFEPGETIDLGTIDITSDERPEMKRTKAAVTSSPSRRSSKRASDDARPTADESTQHVKGRVVGPDGEPVAGATVLAAWVFDGDGRPRAPRQASQRYEHTVLAETKSDGAGNFDLTFSKQNPEEGRLSHGWHIAAFAPEFGPAWSRDVNVVFHDRSPTLQLARDAPIHGRIVDLEGNPIAGVSVRIHELRMSDGEQAVLDWIEQAKESKAPATLDDYLDGARHTRAFPVTRQGNSGLLAQGSAALPADTTTDEEGRFEFDGLGANRLVTLEIEGASVAKSHLCIVTRDMEPLSAKPLNFVGARNDIYRGCNFEYVATPTQPIAGTVTDVETGAPIADVEVRLVQFDGIRYGQQDFLTTRTDENGNYRLVGAPQGGGHRIEVNPVPDQPYFPTDTRLPSDSSGFDSIDCDFELRRGSWIVGKVTDAESGEPIVDATVEYLPLRSNERAQNYPNYDPEITGSTPDDRYRTNKEGRFRVLAIPGAGILAAIGRDDDRHAYLSLTAEMVAEHLLGEGQYLNTYHPWTVTGYHALREVELSESQDGKEAEFELEVTRGATRLVKLVDADGEPVTGARVLGRVFPPNLEAALDASSFEMIGLRPREERVVAIVHSEKRVGRALLIGAGDGSTVELQPCAVVRGRAVDEDGQPIEGLTVQVTIDRPDTDTWHRGLIGATTDADGRFEVWLPPGLTCRVWHYVGGSGPDFSAECEATPGAVFDLGDLADGMKLTTDQTAKMIVASETGDGPSTPMATSGKRSEDSIDGNDVTTVHGRVVDAEGKPVAGAAVRLPDDVSVDGQATSTDVDGRFEIEFDKAKFTKPEWHQQAWRRAQLIATADGFAPTWVSGDELVAADASPTLVLKRDDLPISGQILTLEGEPVANATLEIWDIHEPYSGSLDGLLETLRESPMEVQTYVNRELRFLPGRLLELQAPRGTFGRTEQGNPIITADSQGRFEIRGVGPERLLRALVTAPNIQSTQIKLLTRNEIEDHLKRKSLDDEARLMLDSGSALPQVYPATFKLFAGPSSPITGLVRDRDTGEPIAGIRVAGWLRNTDNHASATTDENGRYELTGLGVEGTFQQLHAGPGEEESEKLAYLGAEKSKITFSSAAPLTKEETDFELTRGIVVRGKVTDAVTGEPVKARVEYMGYADNPHLKELRDELWPYGNPITDEMGEFAIVVPPGPGALAVWTQLSSDVPDRYRPVDSEDFGLPIFERGWISTTNRGHIHPWSYKAAQFIDFALGAESPAVNFTVEPLTDLTPLRCVDEEGRPVDDVSVAGHLPWSGNYIAIMPRSGLEVGEGKGAYIEIAELGAKSRRPVVFREIEGNLAAILYPSRDTRKPRLADLKRAEDGVHLITLRPSSSIIGQLVDSERSPVTNAGVELQLVTESASGVLPMEVDDVSVDAQGRFELRDLPAGGPYRLTIVGESLSGGIVRRDIEIAAGEKLDLGAIDITKSESPPRPNRAESRIEAKVTVNSAAQSDVAARSTEPADGAKKEVAPEAADGASNESIEYAGSVIAPNGQPADGAKIFLVYHIPEPTQALVPAWQPMGETDAAGKFRFVVKAKDLPGSEREWSAAPIVAVKDGYGFAWSMSGLFETSGKLLDEYRARLADAPPEARVTAEKMLGQIGEPLRLVADGEPIRGQVLDINGQPVAGARLTLLEVLACAEDDLSPWLKAAQENKADYYSARMQTPRAMHGPQVRSLVTPAVTDAEGRFTLRGIGRERIANILVEGLGIESSKIFARTRAGEKIEIDRERRSPDLGKYVYHPVEVVHLAGPSRAIVGVVRDRETNEPLAGVTIRSQKRHGHAITGWGEDFVRTVTDAEGRYRLEGMPIGDDNRIAAIAPADRAYMPMSQKANTGNIEQELELDFDLPPAVWIEGRVTDKQSGQGLAGRLEYFMFPDNSHLEGLSGIGNVDLRDQFQADDDGQFRIPALPGRGIVGFMAHDHREYPRGAGAEKIAGGKTDIGALYFPTEPSYCMPMNFHVLAEVEPEADAERLEVNLQLDAGGTIVGRIVDADGEPLDGARYSGRLAEYASWDWAKGATFEIVGYDPTKPRRIVVYHAEQNLVALHILRDAAPDEFVVKLGPAGTARGRVVDSDGEPLGGLALMPWQRPMQSPMDDEPSENIEPRVVPLPPTRTHSGSGQHETDESGRFEIAGLVPGVEYRLRASDRAGMTPARGRMPRISGVLERVIVVEAGQTLDLGDVRLTDDEKVAAGRPKEPAMSKEPPKPIEPPTSSATNKGAAPQETRTELTATSATSSKRITGRVVGPDGRAVAGAHLAAIGASRRVARGGDLESYRDAVLVEAMTDADGRYDLELVGVSSKTHWDVMLVASADGMGLAWEQINPDATRVEAPFELAAEAPIRGRLVDIEGRPGAGVRMSIDAVMVTTIDGKIPDGARFRNSAGAPAAWPPPVVTDREGRFTIYSVAAGYGVSLEVEAIDRFAPQNLLLNTGIAEERGERDGTYRPLVKNLKAGEEAVLALAPAQNFEGIVRYEDTGKPAPHARLTIWASQEKFGSMTSVAGKADAEGRYHISPYPGIRFGVTAYPPDGAAYLTRQLPAVDWEDAATIKEVDVTLPRGVMVRGKVIESQTSMPVAGATIQYIPEGANNPHDADDILTGWQGIQLSNDKGEFEIVVLPGPGRLLVHGPRGEYVLQETSSRELNSGRPGGERNYANAIERLEPEPGAEPIDLEVKIECGEQIVGRVVDESGAPVDEALVITQLHITPQSPYWRGFPLEALGGRFELSGLKADQEYETYFLDPKNCRGATVTLSADDRAPEVVLEPCGQATARFINREGQPLAGLHRSIRMVVTPGPPEYDFKAAEKGELAADADFVSNIDRTNHWHLPPSDSDGRIVYPALIPGATYRLLSSGGGEAVIAREFSVTAGQLLDLGDIVVQQDD